MALSLSTISMPFYETILDFLARGPSVKELVQFRAPAEVQDRFEELLQKNRESLLSPNDAEELERYIQIERMMSLIKAKAYRHLEEPV